MQNFTRDWPTHINKTAAFFNAALLVREINRHVLGNEYSDLSVSVK